MNVQLTDIEIDIILDWYAHSNSSFSQFGGAEFIFPSELILLKKLKSKPEYLDLTDSELELISDLMQKSISRRYGNAQYLFGFEQQLFNKINSLLSKLHQENC